MRHSAVREEQFLLSLPLIRRYEEIVPTLLLRIVELPKPLEGFDHHLDIVIPQGGEGAQSSLLHLLPLDTLAQVLFVKDV